MRYITLALSVFIVSIELNAQGIFGQNEMIVQLLNFNEVKGKVSYKDQGGDTVTFVFANSTVQSLYKNFSEEYRQISIASDKRKLLFNSLNHSVYLFIDPFYQSDRIHLYVLFDRIRIKKNEASVVFHTTSPLYQRKDQIYWSFVCTLKRNNGKWIANKIISKREEWKNEFAANGINDIEKK